MTPSRFFCRFLRRSSLGLKVARDSGSKAYFTKFCNILLIFTLCVSCSSLSVCAETVVLKNLRLSDGLYSKSFIEFRARVAAPHAFILLGRELNDGTKVYFAAGGFYPKSNCNYQSLADYRNVVYGNGEVRYTFEDAAAGDTISYLAYITPRQEGQVLNIMEQWNYKKYALIWQNCVDMASEIAETLGLRIYFTKTQINEYSRYPTFPWQLITTLRANNNPATPLIFAAKQEQGTSPGPAPQGEVPRGPGGQPQTGYPPRTEISSRPSLPDAFRPPSRLPPPHMTKPVPMPKPPYPPVYGHSAPPSPRTPGTPALPTPITRP